MSFREKTAWAMMIVMIGGAIFYFKLVWLASTALGETAPPILPFVVAYIVLIVIASVVLLIALAVSAPTEADAPVDEREKLVEDRAGHISGSILGIGVFAGMIHYGLKLDGNFLFHATFASLMLSQIAEYGVQIWFYRRGV